MTKRNCHHVLQQIKNVNLNRISKIKSPRQIFNKAGTHINDFLVIKSFLLFRKDCRSEKVGGTHGFGKQRAEILCLVFCEISVVTLDKSPLFTHHFNCWGVSISRPFQIFC